MGRKRKYEKGTTSTDRMRDANERLVARGGQVKSFRLEKEAIIALKRLKRISRTTETEIVTRVLIEASHALRRFPPVLGPRNSRKRVRIFAPAARGHS